MDDTLIESIIISKTRGYDSAITWLKDHNYDWRQEEHLTHYFKFRQYPKDMFDHFTTRWIEAGAAYASSGAIGYIIGHIKKKNSPPKIATVRCVHPSGEYTVAPDSRESQRNYDDAHPQPFGYADPKDSNSGSYLWRE
jgi:hypothetical protein